MLRFRLDSSEPASKLSPRMVSRAYLVAVAQRIKGLTAVLPSLMESM